MPLWSREVGVSGNRLFPAPPLRQLLLQAECWCWNSINKQIVLKKLAAFIASPDAMIVSMAFTMAEERQPGINGVCRYHYSGTSGVPVVLAEQSRFPLRPLLYRRRPLISAGITGVTVIVPELVLASLVW